MRRSKKSIGTSLLYVIFEIAVLSSCAHKSGHRRDSGRRSETTMAQKVVLKPKTTQSSRSVGDNDLSGREIFQRYNTAVFMVFTSDGEHTFQGTGFFISNDGLAVSNYHVFEGTILGKENIKFPGQNAIYHVSEVYVKSEEKDFILFRVNCSESNYLPIAKSQPSVGDKVYALGSPRGLENTFSSGEISQWRDKDVMQINVPIDHGSSGGALINSRGEVVGITSGSLYEESNASLNYAMSIEIIKPYLE